jgi:AraC-like DNA-binding protein
MEIDKIEYKVIKPNPLLSPFVESFWILVNKSDDVQEMIILPDGRVDVFFSYSNTDAYHVSLMGLETHAEQVSFAPRTLIFAVSFKLLAIEYLLHMSIAEYIGYGCTLPAGLWGISKEDLDDFDAFCEKVSGKLKTLIPADIDARKMQLFEMIYSSNGTTPVHELSEKVYWSSRQINRYFNQWFGISLKHYCDILRFRASFQHIKEGKLFPEEAFTDQSHFIKNVKKYAGVIPKELSKNKNDRFIQFSTLPKK